MAVAEARSLLGELLTRCLADLREARTLGNLHAELEWDKCLNDLFDAWQAQ